MAIYKQRFFLGLHGTAPNNQVSVDFTIRTALAPDADGWNTLCAAQAAVLKTILCSSVTIVRVLNSPMNKPGTAPPLRGSQIPKYLGIAGTRVSAGNKPVAVNETVALFGKTGAYGYPGVTKIRGCYFTDETIADGSGTLITQAPFTVAPFNAFGAAMIAATTANGATLVLPPKRGGIWGTDHRPITSMLYTGADFYQVDKSRKSNKQKASDIVSSTLKEIQRRYNEASRDEDGNPIAPGAAIIQTLFNIFWDLIVRYGRDYVLTRALPPAARVVLLPMLPPAS